MFYLFIGESIGTSELFLIIMVALMIFGPRKLPELARKIGKTMADLRSSTDDFKKTWAREIEMEEFEKQIKAELNPLDVISQTDEKIIEKTAEIEAGHKSLEISAPEVREISKEDLKKTFPKVEQAKTNVPTDKRDWL
jgi:sec-independent protein translocase protein TatB